MMAEVGEDLDCIDMIDAPLGLLLLEGVHTGTFTRLKLGCPPDEVYTHGCDQ